MSRKWELATFSDSFGIRPEGSVNINQYSLLGDIVDGMLCLRGGVPFGASLHEIDISDLKLDEYGRIVIHPASMPKPQKPKATAVRRTNGPTDYYMLFVNGGSFFVGKNEINLLSDFLDITLMIIEGDRIPETLEECLELVAESKIGELRRQANAIMDALKDMMNTRKDMMNTRDEIFRQIEQLKNGGTQQ